MTSILTRYVLREYLVPFAYCLGGFVSIYVLFELFGSFSRLMAADLPVGVAVQYFCAYLAPFVGYLAPAALMLAAIYTMWNLCRHSELTAMRASGVGFAAIVRPILGVACLTAAFVWWVGDFYVPRTADWAQQMKTYKFDRARLAKADNLVYRNAVENRTWTVDSLADESAEHLRNVKVAVDRPDGGARLYNVLAERVDYLDGEWWFRSPRVQHFDVCGVETVSPTPELDHLTLRTFGFRERPSDFLMLNRKWEFNSIRDRFRYLRTHPDLSPEMRNKYRYDTWAKVFAPLACLVITLFAIPAGVTSGRQSVFRGILGALIMFFSFYALTIACMIVANLGWLHPVVAAALPHGLFFVLGLRLFWRNR